MNFRIQNYIRASLLVILLLTNLTATAQTPDTISQGVDETVLRVNVKKPSISSCDREAMIDSVYRPYVIKDSSNNLIWLVDTNGHITFINPCDKPGFWSNCKPYFPYILIFLALIISVYVIRSLIKRNARIDASQSESALWKNYVTKTISVVLLITFVLSLVLLFFVTSNIDETSGLSDEWFEMFKNYLLLLGTSFTTIMGYFFGQNQAEKLEKNNLKLEQELKNQGTDVNEYIKKLERQRDILSTKLAEKSNEELMQQ